MTNIQRKYLVVSSPLLFSLCCLSPLSSHTISFEDILAQSAHPSYLLLEQDTIPFNNPFTAKEESAPILWNTTTLLFPVLPEVAPTVQEELRLSNVPIYLSYLEYILLQEKKHQHAISFSLLPQLFYRNLPISASKISFETALKAPLPLIRPIEESLLLEALLEASAAHPADLNTLESESSLSTSHFQYIPPIQQALSLIIDKQVLPSGKLHSLHTSSLEQRSPKILSDISFTTQKTEPSSEHPIQELPTSSAKYPLLGESPVSSHEFTPIHCVSPMGELLPAPHVPTSDTLPLSHNYSHIPSPNILFASDVKQEQRLSILSPHTVKELVDITLPSLPIPRAPQGSFDSSAPPFSSHTTNFLCKEITHPSILEHPHLPKNSHLHMSKPIALHHLYLAEEGPKMGHLSPSFEPYIQWRFHRSTFVPGTSDTYVDPSLSFNTIDYTPISTRYVHKLPVQKEPIFMRADPYASDALVTYITSHTTMPSIRYMSIKQPALNLFSPKYHDTTSPFPLPVTTVAFEHPLDNSSDPPIRFRTTHYTDTYSLYAGEEELPSKYPSDDLLYGRMPSPHLMDALESVRPKRLSLLIETALVGGVIPETEYSTFSKTTDYPFLEEFYAPLNSPTRSFLLSYTPAIPLSIASSLPYDKLPADTSTTLSGALTLLESLGNQQMIDSSCHPNPELLSNMHPDRESHAPTTLALLETPDPTYFTVFYTGLNSPLVFATSPLVEALSYTSTLSIDTAKKILPAPESLLSPELESLHQEYSCAVTHDFPDAHTPLTPHSEVSNLLSYRNLYQAKLNHYALSTDKNSTVSSTMPQLLADAHISPALVTPKIDVSPSRKNAALLNQSSRNIQENLTSFPTLQELHTLSLSDEFSVDVQIAQNSKGSGYLFSITLEPKLKEFAVGAPQNFIFLVDRSSSIDKNRLQIFKQAINKALPYLKENDTFNVLSFDTEISKMSHDSVSVNSSTKHGARRFLESQKRGYKYVLPNLYSILLQVHTMVKDSPLPTTVVLLTNGKSLENFNTQDERLARLISTNQNGFTLFTACSSQNNNTLMLEILSNLNRGEFMHSQTNAAFPRKLASFVKHAGSLLAKDIHVSAAKADPNLTIEFFPDTALAPNLYGDRPYTIVGKMDQLCDFDLVLQGRFCDNWLNVTKKISFKTARYGGHSIYKDYTMHMAYNKYREFLQEGNTASLDEAKKVLQPFNLSY